MTDQEIDRLLALEAEATPGPWRYEEAETIPETGEFREGMIWADGDGSDANPDRHIAVVRIGLQESDDNGRFLSAARSALKPLALEVRRLRQKLAAVERERDDWREANTTNIEIQKKFQAERDKLRDDVQALVEAARALYEGSWGKPKQSHFKALAAALKPFEKKETK